MTNPTSPQAQRRDVLQAAAALALAPSAMAAPGTASAPNNRIPEPSAAMRMALPAKPTPGKPGDFDFLSGHWRIVQQRKLPTGEWDFFEGEASVYGLLGGVVSVEELRIPSRNFSGMGLRVLDIKQQLWSDYWVNAAWGVMPAPPALTGSFEGGAGIFVSEETVDGKLMRYRSVWDQIAVGRCRWQQGASGDGGKTWQVGWSMDWLRIAEIAAAPRP